MSISGSQSDSSGSSSSSSTSIIGTEYRIDSIKDSRYIVRYSIRIGSKISSNSRSDIRGSSSLSRRSNSPSIDGTTYGSKVTHGSVGNSDIASSKGSSSFTKCSGNYKRRTSKISSYTSSQVY